MSERESQLRKVPFHQALWRHSLMFGCERTLGVVAVVVPAYLAFILSIRFGPWYGVPAAAACAGLLLFVGQKMAKRDEQLTQVLRRMLKYRGYYPANSHVFVKDTPWRSALRSK